MNARSLRYNSTQRRGGIVVLVAVSLVVIFGFAVLAIDLGRLYLTRAELQRAADSAALAGASAYCTNAGLMQNLVELAYLTDERAQDFSLHNPTLHTPTVLDIADIAIGTYDYSFPDAALDTSGVARFNAVRVIVRRTSGSSNGPVALFFAGVFGDREAGVIAEATAAFDDRFAGFRLEDGGTGGFPSILPITIDINRFETMMASGDDEFSYDQQPQPTADGVPEVALYPWKVKTNPNNPGDDYVEVEPEGSGNFGLLAIGPGGASGAADSITNGLSAADIAAALGTSDLTYCDDAGNPTSYTVLGSTGIKASLTDELQLRAGDVVGFFLHDDVSGTGSNTEFHNVGFRFGRIMEVNLSGSNKRLVMQPVAYTGSAVVVSENAPSSNGQIGRLVLVR